MNKLDKKYFGELMQAMYNCEIHFWMGWTWDMGMEVRVSTCLCMLEFA